MPFHPPARLNIADYFLDDRIREGLGGRTALRTADGPVTYAELQERANRFANLLRELGARPADRILIALPDGPDFAAALFGALKAGAVGVMANPFLREREAAELCAYARPAAIVVHNRQARTFALAAEAARPGSRARLVALGTSSGDHAVASADPRFENHPARPGDPAIWLFSGGTTGRPKAVVQPHASFVNSTELYAKGVIGYAPDDIAVSVPKLFFGYATGSNLLFPLAVGASAALFPERCTADEIFARIARHRPTILVNVPTMVSRMVNHPDARRQDLGSLRLATSAGEPLPPSLHRRWNDLFGVELLDGLGTAEMWHVFISNRPGSVRPGTLGPAVPGFDVRLCDERGREVPPGEVGRMRVRGGSLAAGYWQRPAATKRAFVGEWHVSGDMMTRGENGVFTYQGRADDLLKVSGKWFSPGEVEECLLAHPGVSEAAVVGVEDDAGLVVPAAFVVPAAPDSAHRPASPRSLSDHARAHLPSYKVPRRITLLADLPRTHLGKVDRGALKRMSRQDVPS